MITNDEIRALLNDIESDRVERTTSTTNTDKFCEAVCAFANDLPNHRQPGYLFIGVNDDGEIQGADITDRFLQYLSDFRTSGNILPQPTLIVEKREFPEGAIAMVVVHPSNYPPVRYKGRTWIRIGPRKGYANEAEERLLIERRVAHATTFDARPCFDASLDDLLLDIFKNQYLTQAVNADELNADFRNVEEQLASLRLFDPINKKPTNAAVLLFGKNPERFLSGAYIQYVRFAGKDNSAEIAREFKFTGPLVRVLEKLDNFVETSIVNKKPVSVSALREVTVVDYPYLSIRELLMNAVMHREYETNTFVKFYEYNDRIEIINPGGLYGLARPENFPRVNDYRNPVIAEAMKILGYVNRFNRGIARVQTELRANKNNVEFNVNNITTFEVVVGIAPNVKVPINEPKLNLPTMQQKIVDLMTANNKVTISIISKELGISNVATSVHVNRLKKKGVIKRIGSKRYGEWQVVTD